MPLGPPTLPQLAETADTPSSFQVGIAANAPPSRCADHAASILTLPAKKACSTPEAGDAATSRCPPSSAVIPSVEPLKATTFSRFALAPTDLATCAAAMWL